MEPTLAELSKRYDIPEEVLRLAPPTPPARGRARQRADVALGEQYAGNHVAYIDTWTGDELERTVVAVAAEIAEFHKKLAELPPDVKARVTRTYLTPADTINAPAAWLGD